MIPVKKTARLACLLFLLFSASLAAADGLSVTDIKGKTHSPFNDKSVKGVALIFITTDCPVANYFHRSSRLDHFTLGNYAAQFILKNA